MDFEAFKRLALTTLLECQDDNGSWFNDPVATASAAEVLAEELYGPDPICTTSLLFKEIHSEARDIRFLVRPYPYRFELGSSDRDERVYYSALSNALWSRAGIIQSYDPADQSRAWMIAKRFRIITLTDPDYQFGFESVYQRLIQFDTREPWLMAQIGHGIGKLVLCGRVSQRVPECLI